MAKAIEKDYLALENLVNNILNIIRISQILEKYLFYSGVKINSLNYRWIQVKQILGSP